MFFQERPVTSESHLLRRLLGKSIEIGLKNVFRAEDEMKKSYHSQKSENTKL